MFFSIRHTLLLVHSTLGAVISPIFVLQSTSNGVVYLNGPPPALPTSDSTDLSSRTPSVLSDPAIASTSNSTTYSEGAQSALSNPAITTSSNPTTYTDGAQSALSTPAMTLTSNPTSRSDGAQSTPAITGLYTSNSSRVWPATITFVAQTGTSTAVGIAFVTTVNGTSKITTTQPQQSFIPAISFGSGYGLVAITESGTTTTLTLDDLPTATLPSEPTGIQVVIQSGTPVTYSPITLSGYDNTEPVEISTSFTETVDGHTTIQGGWWLIGIGGRIYPPSGRPWRIGSGIGCLAGPLICRKDCIDIGLLHICQPSGSGKGGGEDGTGPPGFPGGPVDGEGEPSADPPPYDQVPPDEEPEKETGSEASRTIDATSASMTEPASTSASMSTSPTSGSTFASTSTSTSASSSVSSSASMSVAQYFVVATPGADVAEINAFLGQIAPKSSGTYAPLFATNTVDGGFWTANLSPEGAASASSRTDLSIIETFTNTPTSYSTWTPSVFSDTATASLETLYASTLSPTETAAAVARREVSDEESRSDSGPSYQNETRDRNAEARFKNPLEEREPSRLFERDAGIRTVRQVVSPKDLSVLSWAPSVPSVDDVDYIFSERKGENTWVYVLDTGINAQHSEFRKNWPGTYGQFNIDPEVLQDPTTDFSKVSETQSHGTCMASKVCGAKTGAAKQTRVISVISADSPPSTFAGLNLILNNIITRQNKNQALPGRTVLSMSFAMHPSFISKQEGKYLQSLLQAIMNLGVMCVCSAGNGAKTMGFPRTHYPAVLASATFPLIAVGAVDITGKIAEFSQEGIVYTVGVNSPCAAYYDYQMEDNADGTSGANAMMAGLIALKLSEPGNVYGFGDDKTKYQQLVRDYYTVGYNRRKPNQHPPGSFYRPGSYAAVAWNGLDGSRSNVCPLIWAPDGALKKRQTPTTADPATSGADICSAYHAHSVIIYSRVPKSCQGLISNNCPFNYYLYAVSGPTGVPAKICNGDGFIGSVEKANPAGNSIPFTLPKATGEDASDDLNFVYTWTAGDSSGWISGASLANPVTCVSEVQLHSPLSQTCSFQEPDSSKRKRYDGFPSTYMEDFVYAPFARCFWGSGG